MFASHYDDAQDMAGREVCTTKRGVVQSVKEFIDCPKPKGEDWSILVEEYTNNHSLNSGIYAFGRSWTWRPGLTNNHYGDPPPWL